MMQTSYSGPDQHGINPLDEFRHAIYRIHKCIPMDDVFMYMTFPKELYGVVVHPVDAYVIISELYGDCIEQIPYPIQHNVLMFARLYKVDIPMWPNLLKIRRELDIYYRGMYVFQPN